MDKSSDNGVSEMDKEQWTEEWAALNEKFYDEKMDKIYQCNKCGKFNCHRLDSKCDGEWIEVTDASN